MLSGILCCIYCHVFESPKQISLNLPGILVTSCHLVIVTHTRTQPPGLETMSLDIAQWAFPGLASLTSPALCNDEGLAPYPHSASCTSVLLPVLLSLSRTLLPDPWKTSLKVSLVESLSHPVSRGSEFPLALWTHTAQILPPYLPPPPVIVSM